MLKILGTLRITTKMLKVTNLNNTTANLTISWPFNMNMQMNELIMSSPPHNFPLNLYTEMTQISYFSYENGWLALIPLWIDAEWSWC